MRELGASSCSFYVQDPWWAGEMRLQHLPGVQHAEPMHGFLMPLSAKRIVTQGAAEFFYVDTQNEPSLRSDGGPVFGPILQSLAIKNPLFGDFVRREGVRSTARFIHGKGDKSDAALFVNFNQANRFSPNLKRQLRHLWKDMRTMLPDIEKEATDEQPFPVTQLLRILRLTEEQSASSLEANFERILQTALQACGLHTQTDIGTIHVFDSKEFTLTRSANVGALDSGVPIHQDVRQGEGVISWVALWRRAILISDLQKSGYGTGPNAIHIRIRKNMRSELAVPILDGEQLLGVLNLESGRPNAFTRNSVRVIWYAANQAAAAYRASERSLNLLRICSGMPDRIAHAEPLNELAGFVRDQLRADLCDIWQYDAEKGVFKAAGVTTPELRPGVPPRDEGVGWSHYVRRIKTAVLINDIKDAQTFTVHLWDTTQRREWRHPTAAERACMPKTINTSLVELDVHDEVGLPIPGLAQPESIGIAWLKYKDADRVPQAPDAVKALFGWAGQIAVVLECLRKQQEHVRYWERLSHSLHAVPRDFLVHLHFIAAEVLSHPENPRYDQLKSALAIAYASGIAIDGTRELFQRKDAGPDQHLARSWSAGELEHEIKTRTTFYERLGLMMGYNLKYEPNIQKVNQEYSCILGRLRGALDVLMVNAFRYGQSNVELRVFEQHPEFVVEVRDFGKGLPQDFCISSQTERYHKHLSGSGKGLYNAREALKDFGGDLRFGSVANGPGARFQLAIPRCGA